MGGRLSRAVGTVIAYSNGRAWIEIETGDYAGVAFIVEGNLAIGAAVYVAFNPDDQFATLLGGGQ